MITQERLKQALSGIVAPADLDRVAESFALALQEAVQAEVERRVAAMAVPTSQAYQQLDAKVQALLDLAHEGVRIAVENTRAIEQLRAVTEQHSAQIEQLRLVTEQHSAQIAENTRAIEQLRLVTEQHSAQIAENTRAIEQLRAVAEQHNAQIAENTRAITRLEQSIERLVQAEQRLTRRTDDIARQLGGLAMNVGYTLENAAYPVLPELLWRDHQIRVLTELKRDFIEDAQGNEYEVNIFGEGERDGQRVIIVGESKMQLSKPDIDRFLRRKLKPLQRILGGQELFPVLVAHMVTSKKVLPYAQERGVAVYLFYQFQRNSLPSTA